MYLRAWLYAATPQPRLTMLETAEMQVHDTLNVFQSDTWRVRELECSQMDHFNKQKWFRETSQHL